ncbi:MAG: TonB-dependent receptor [Spirochaetia bacterium]|jgi:outer membrane cobalamin receptor|nr:TonB-dependent receptor [Spirochaetia bacterium]
MISIRLYAGENAQPADVFSDEEITVVGTPETTQQIRTISKEDIERSHAPDLAALLEDILDLPVTRYGPYGNVAGINMRGFGSGRVAILIDGVPANSPQSGDFEISMIDVNSIEKIEVIYGGSDTTHNVSGAIGGVINIITVKKQKPGWRFGGGVSNTSAMPGKYYTRQGKKDGPETRELFDTQHAGVFTRFGGNGFSWSADAFANRAQNHFTFEDTYGTTRRRENNEVWDTGTSTSFIWDMPKDIRLIAGGDIYYGDKNIPGPMFSVNTGKQKDFSSRQNLLLNMPRIFANSMSTEFSLNHTWQNLDFQDSTSDSLHKTHVIQAVNRWTYRLLPEVTMKAGGDYRYSYLNSTNLGIKDGHDGGAYITAEVAIHRNFLVVPHVKVISNGTVLVPVPKFGLVWYAADRLTLKNNYFRNFKFPDFNDLYWTGDATAKGNPDLKPEDGIGADFIAEYTWKGIFNLETSLSAQRIKDSIHWRSIGGVWEPVNIGEAALFGWDSRIVSNFSDWIIVSFSYQYVRSYILTDDLTYASNIRMPYIPMHTAGASVEFRWNSGSLHIAGHYEGLRYTETLNISTLDPHFLLNIIFNQKINKNLTAFAALRNILNTSYVSMLDYPMPGITFTMGIKTAY